MNIKQQLEQVIAEMDEAVAKVAACEISIIGTDCIQDWSSRLSAIVEQMNADERAIVEEVNKRWPQGKPQPDDTFVGAAPQLPDGMVLKLPCDVRLPPNLIIRKGCKIETLMEALKVRDGRDVQWADPKEAAKSLIAAAKEEG